MVTGEGLTGSEMQGKLGFLDMGSSSCLEDQTLELNFVLPNATAMLARQTDWRWVRNRGQFDAYVEDDQIQIATRGHLTLWLNPRNTPFDNVRVRQTVTMVIDRETGIRILQDGHGAAGFQMSPGSSQELDQTTGCAVPGWCPPEGGDWGRPPCRGQGHSGTGILPFDQTLTVESNEPVQARATFFQAYQRSLGVQSDFDPVETVVYRKQTSEGSWGDILPRNDTMPADAPAPGMGNYFRCVSALNHWTPGLRLRREGGNAARRCGHHHQPGAAQADLR